MKILLYFFFFIILKCYILLKCLHLTKDQFYLINNLIKKNNLSIKQRETLNKILYLSFEKLSIKKAIEFKKYHYHKCKNINIDDLIVSSKFGLFKSIQKYNGNSNFIYYTDIYIRSELLKTLTNYFSLSIIPRKIRIKNKTNYTKLELNNYNKLLQTRLVSYSNQWQFDKLNINKENILDKLELFEYYIEFWRKINSLKSFQKQIIHYKYDFEFNKIRSNKKISELLCCTEENIRFNLIKAINLVK
jgi:hypothetical protein